MVDFSWPATGGLKSDDAIAVPTQEFQEITKHGRNKSQRPIRAILREQLLDTGTKCVLH